MVSFIRQIVKLLTPVYNRSFMYSKTFVWRRIRAEGMYMWHSLGMREKICCKCWVYYWFKPLEVQIIYIIYIQHFILLKSIMNHALLQSALFGLLNRAELLGTWTMSSWDILQVCLKIRRVIESDWFAHSKI